MRVIFLGLIHVSDKIKVPPLSEYEPSVCNTVQKLCQLRENLYSCHIYIDMTDANAMLNEGCVLLVFVSCIFVFKCMLKCIFSV